MSNIIGYKIFSNISEANNWLSSVNNELGLPNNFGTNNYTLLINHPINDKIYTMIDSGCPQSLMPSNLVDFSQIKLEGFCINDK